MRVSTVLRAAAVLAAAALVSTASSADASGGTDRAGGDARHRNRVASYSMRDLGHFYEVADINDRGEVAGHWGGYEEYDDRVLLWTGGRLHEVGFGAARDLNNLGQVAATSCGHRTCGASIVSLGSRLPLPLVPTDYEFPSAGATALNDRAQVIGTSNWVGVRWWRGELLDLGLRPNAINERGQIAGQMIWSEEAPWQDAAIWSDGRVRRLGTLGGRSAEATAIDAWGRVAGTSETTTEAVFHAFFWSRGRMRDLGTLGGDYSAAVAMNDRGQVAGDSLTADGSRHAFLWSRGRMHDLGTLGGPTSNASAINIWGQVVGTSDTADGARHAFVWSHGRMHDLGTLGGSESSAAAINVWGQVAGLSRDAEGRQRGVLWSPRLRP
jgi:probable HAF family extracellular repeat protein